MTLLRNQDIQTLHHFKDISLSEMDSVKLMNRTDTKFVFKRTLLSDLLVELKSKYQVLNIEGHLISSYKTLYFDTKDFRLYQDHHNKKGNRFKVRIRNYVESKLFFLEIKNKYKGRTIKNRISVEDFELELAPFSALYVNKIMKEEIQLEPKLWNSFERITLVNNHDKERVTLDIGLAFEFNGKDVSYNHVVVAELKQENANRVSLFYSLMKEHEIRPCGLSKYCIGAIALYPELKYNSFKEKIILIDKLI